MKIKELTALEFASAVKFGLGRALLHVAEYGDNGIEEEIVEALRTNHVWDMQIEGVRSDWIAQIVASTGRIRFYAGKMLEIVGQPGQDRYDLVHQVYLCRWFVDHGYLELRPHMFSRFAELIAQKFGSAVVGCELWSVGGLKGLEFVAREIGAHQNFVDDFDCALIYSNAVEELDETAVRTSMSQLALTDISVKSFMNAVERHEIERLQEPGMTPRPHLTIEEVLAKVDNEEEERFGFSYKRFGAHASEQDLGTISKLLLETNDSRKQVAFLRVLAGKSLPSTDEKILALLYSEDSSVRRAAGAALCCLKHDAVRGGALDLLQFGPSDMVDTALEMLKPNFQHADSPLILDALKRLEHPLDLHRAITDLCNLAEGTGLALAQSLLFAYENGPCSFCRQQVLELLYASALCPEVILYEAQFDGCEEVQYFARSISAAQEL